ncbi:protein XRI1-like [Cocos nucifera]|nr:protein XRI1-like [Cocos nucifera]
MESPMSSEASTGYLQDAVAAWSDRCKRRRMTSNCDDDPISMTNDLQDLLQEFWDSNCHVDPLDDLNYMLQDNSTVSEDLLNSSMPMKGPSAQEAFALQHQQEPLSSLSSQEEPLSTDTSGKVTKESKDTKASHPSLRLIKSFSLKETESWSGKKKEEAMGVAYPFAVVKPGGLEGDVTLDDINARILMRPARPVRHPVGEFAGGPCVSADGPGLSGKAVVSLTRIHTKGRGTITIIRTKG